MNKVILFTRVPKAGTTKTRLYDFLSKEEACNLQKKMLQKIYNDLKKWGNEIIIYHSGNSTDNDYMYEVIGEEHNFKFQKGSDLGEKMANAIETELALGASKVILVGSDIVDLKKEIIDAAFSTLDTCDVAINPTFDGGYYLIGFKNKVTNIFNISNYGTSSVFENTVKNIKQLGLSYSIGEQCSDIDTKEDLISFETGYRDVELLGAGEYNVNFLYSYNDIEKRVIRFNMKSQMNLENQMAYEYRTLKLLEDSGVTPKVYNLEESPKWLPYKYLTMEYLKGRPLDYRKDMDVAAYLLSKLHNTRVPNNHGLIEASSPFELMYEECSNMANEYLTWQYADAKVMSYLQKFLESCKNKLNSEDKLDRPCFINTELNSGNFIIGKDEYSSYIIDWEKALIGDCEQDLAHFLAPTTTFWKTDIVLTHTEIENFLTKYEEYRNINIEKFNKYLVFTCLRGVTWCSMAYRQYSEKDKMLTNDETFNKIKQYLEYSFLEALEKYFNDK